MLGFGKKQPVVVEPPAEPTELDLARLRVFETCAAFDHATQAMRDWVPSDGDKAQLRLAQAVAARDFYRAQQAYARLKEESSK